MEKKHQIKRYAGMMLLALFVVATVSCERDLFWVNDIDYDLKPVKLTVGFELPNYNSVTTRSLSPEDEHSVNNFYLMIFQNNPADPGSSKLVKRKLFYPYELADKSDFVGEEDTWVSVETKYNEDYSESGDINSSNGYVVMDDVEIDTSKGIYVFGFANILPLKSNNNDSEDPKSLTAKVLWKGELLTPYEVFEKDVDDAIKDDEFDTLQDLWDLQVQLNNLADYQVEQPIDSKQDDSLTETLLKTDIFNREYPNLLYSGAWSTWTKKMTGTDGKTHNYYENLSGFISPDIFASFLGGGQSYDLRNLGMIYLRSLVAHVKFKITFNEKNIKSFQPESWQIVHVPVRSHFLDRTQTANTALTENIAFGKTVPVKKMTQTEGHYEFDFYMYENQKQATDLDHIDYPDGFNYNYKKQIEGYYERFYGEDMETIPGITEAERALTKYWAITGFGYDRTKPDDDPANKQAKEYFRYAKRDLELKYPGSVGGELGNTVIKNDVPEYPYVSKKYIYSAPKATYVIIRGRINLNPETAEVYNLAGDVYRDEDGHIIDLKPVKLDIVDGYADVAYTIHLGYAGQKDADGNVILDPYNDFNIFRNTNYVYNVRIDGINSIVTSVIADIEVNSKIPPGDPDYEGKYRMKKQPGADGNVNLSMGKVYNLDAHYNQFNFMLTKSGLNDFYFEMHTPWNDINSTTDVHADIDYFKDKYGATWMTDYVTDQLYLRKYKNNPDFNWITFGPTKDQRGLFDDDTDFQSNEEDYVKARPTVKYDANSPTRWNLFDFMVSMDALSSVSAGTPPYDEDGISFKKRMNNVLWGVEEVSDYRAIQGTSQSLFECTVPNDKDYMVNYFKGSYTALPFLLDIRTYELKDIVKNGDVITALEQYQHIRDNYNYSRLNVVSQADERYWYRYKRAYYDEESDKYYAEENYIAFLRDTDPYFSTLQDSQVIRRMFYTAYIDEYYYSEPPYGYSWSKPYWTQFVNMPARYINFGYRANDGSETADTQYSTDKQSSLMTTEITMIQKSIQTFYSTTSNHVYALGLEHVNETHDPRWPDNKNSIGTSGLNHDDGWLNAKRYVVQNNGADWPHKLIDGKDTYYITDGSDYSVWDYYVSNKVWEGYGDGIDNTYYNNVTMRKRTPWVEIGESNRRSRVDDTPIYYAGAIRMCMNRNRDENGNGRIDEDELKWYLPASDQMDLASLCHFSLEDPLFNYNQFYSSNSEDPENKQRFPSEIATNLRAGNLYRYHYVTSDYMIYNSEEGMNSSSYTSGVGQAWASNPYEMRCVRNLNKEPYTDEGRPNNATPRSLDDSRVSDVVKVYTYRGRKGMDGISGTPEYDKGGGMINTFTMDALDDRSIRSLIYHSRELPSPHYLFSSTNLPYKKFQVARDNGKLLEILDVVGEASDKNQLKNIVEKSPCKHYYELEDQSDLGSWRAPNMAEMGLMLIELRTQKSLESNGNIKDYSDPLFLSGTSTCRPFSSTSWNFTGPWGRVIGFKYSNGWDAYSSDAWKIVNGKYQEDWSNHLDDYAPSVIASSNGFSFFVRCVKDLNVIETNKTYPGATSESFK